MDTLQLNKKAWDNIGGKSFSSSIEEEIYLENFNLFCSKLPKNASVLDFGCGPGIPYTKELVKKGLKVTAIDISNTMIEEAKKNTPEAKYIQISMTDIGFEEEFDGIFAGYTMLCLDPRNFKVAAKKVVKALKPGGYLFLTLNEPPPEGPNYAENITEIMGQKIYSRPYTEDEVRAIFSKLDMKIIKVARETFSSEEYGDEYALMVLMQKQ